MPKLAKIAKHDWDAIIVGTGMGGATLGYALARAGWRVLFCEKGKSHLGDAQSLRGDYAENFFSRPKAPQPEHREILSRAGRYSGLIEDRSFFRSRAFIPFIGLGTGGSTALYGMALERFFPADFRPRRNFPNANETTLPEQWPISYADLTPYYEAAEKLYRVRGTSDPLRSGEQLEHLRPPPPLTPAGDELFQFFRQKGLHPYRLPMACEFVPECECCQGYLCARNCKNDASRICLAPAISDYGAELLDECEVLKLEATSTEVTGVVCTWHGTEITLRGKVVVLAAGALESPCILLRSASEHWPNGLGNDSGLVGKNLMRHHIDLHLVIPNTPGPVENRYKELAFNDFYEFNGEKFGSVQSLGRLPAAEIIAATMEQDLRDGPLPGAGVFFKLAKPAITPLLSRLVSRNVALAAILEDLPYSDNLVMPLPPTSGHVAGRLAIQYNIRSQDRKRITAFRSLVRQALKPYKTTLIKQAENNQRIAHACGTCRFGLTREDSVLDKWNRSHGLSNLYVVDGSFFPSSGGTNPALTIGANALRVADHLSGKPTETDIL
ncbi:MAG: GMC family oxidoreductase [Candidatus Nanopelagicaceae bacterium]|nr:GMC family oxidoreductase [Candidatus Nanopelagicaceae bacterium]